LSRVVKNDRIVINAAKMILANSDDLNSIGGQVIAHNDGQDFNTSYSELIKRVKEQAEDIIIKARDKAQIIELEAQKAAAKIMEAAKEEGYSKGYSEGYDKGYAQGLNEGKDLGRAQYDDAIKEAQELRQKYLDDYENLYTTSERYMLELAIEIARKIIGEALDNDDRLYMELAYKALKQVQGQEKVTLRVSSQDFPKVLKNKGILLSKLNEIEEIDIIEDDYLKNGSCIIDTGTGIIDASVDVQMDIIESSLLK
jgi:flagellar assembly protein FliH